MNCPLPVNEFNPELSVCPVSMNEPDCELFATAFLTEKSTCPVPVNGLNFELSACPVLIREFACGLSACSVITRQNIYELFVFSASALETISALSVSCVSVFPRLQSLLCVSDQSVLLWCSSVLHWWAPALSAPPWRSSALSIPHWWAPALSAPPWRSSVLSAPHWWAPALSALPWRSSALSAPHWWAPSAPPWRSSAPSAPPWWAPARSALPWRSSALSAPPWWSAVWFWWSSALPWWSAALSAMSWRSSVPPILLGLSWVPALLALPLLPVPPLAHGPGPPSLPLFRLRSTTLLYYTIWGASGSCSLGGGLCQESGSWSSVRLPQEVASP